MRQCRRSDKWRLVLALPIYTVVFVFGYMFYSATAPVVTDFHVSNQRDFNHHLRIDGVMRKVRNCKFDSLHITSNYAGIETRHNYVFEDTQLVGASRLTGYQHFGPWKIYANRDQRPLTVHALHVCDFGLYTATNIGVIQ